MRTRRNLFLGESDEEGDNDMQVGKRMNDAEENSDEKFQSVKTRFDDDDMEEIKVEEEEAKDLREKEENLEEDLQEEEDPEEDDDDDEDYYVGKKSPTPSDLDQNNNTTTISMPADEEEEDGMRVAQGGNSTKQEDGVSKRCELFQRETRSCRSENRKKVFWSDEDEITLLKGMLNYHSKKKINPQKNMGKFYKFITRFLNVEVSKRQVVRKIKKLQCKYKKNMKNVSNGKEPVFSKRRHEKTLFKLSNSVWGVVEKDKEDEKEEEEEEDNGDDDGDHEGGGEASEANDKSDDQERFWLRYPCLHESLNLEEFTQYLPEYRFNFSFNFIKERLYSLGCAKAEEFEAKWRQLHVAEAEVELRKTQAQAEVDLIRAQLIFEQTKLILDK